MKALGMILAGEAPDAMGGLPMHQAVEVLPVAGSFCCIDFSLSSMVNSGISKVGVITKFHSRSLREHLSSSGWWNFGRKNGGLYIFSPVITGEKGGWYQGTADAMIRNQDFLKNSHEPYVVIASGDTVYKLDFNRVLEFHIEKKADITVVCTNCGQRPGTVRFGVPEMGSDGRILGFDGKADPAGQRPVSAGIYLIRRRLLTELLEEAARNGGTDFFRDVLTQCLSFGRVYGYEMQSYWSHLASLDSYYQTNLDFLKPEIRRFFFHEEPKIRTRLEDLPPVKYLSGAALKNSLVSGGCVIGGAAENSVIAKDVYLGGSSVVKNAVILNHVYVGENAHIENCIVESGTTVHANAYYLGGSEGVPEVLA